MKTTEDKTYNGWSNYETWNVALWIGGDDGLYAIARDAKTYKRFVEYMQVIGDNEPIAFQTPDGIAWNDSGIDEDEMNEMFKEMH